MKSVVSKVVDSKPIKMVSVLVVVEFAVMLQIRKIRCYLMTESCTLFLSYFQRLWSFLIIPLPPDLSTPPPDFFGANRPVLGSCLSFALGSTV